MIRRIRKADPEDEPYIYVGMVYVAIFILILVMVVELYCHCLFGQAWGQSQEVDKFNITELYPTVRDGREWFSSWDNNSRAFGNGVDPADPQFVTQYGDGYYTIDGNGTMSIEGPYPRMYIFDPDRMQTWHNVEITFYGKRISESKEVDWAGLQAYGRTAHVDDYDPCTYRGYGGQMLYNGEMKFEKEVNHHADEGYVDNADSIINPWPSGGPMPKDVWIGYKYVIYNIDDNNEVKLELYRDMTDGKNGGRWEKMTEFIDDGNWGEDAPPCSDEVDPEEVLTEPALSVYIRNDGIEEADYKKFSVREISATE